MNILQLNADDYLLLSGVQHYSFCKRQWALIYIEQQWDENYLTYMGRIMHRNVHDPYFTESRGDVIVSRAVPVVSHKLKVYGITDVIEYHRAETGFSIPGREGFWRAVPVEYKSGKKIQGIFDEAQLCCQAMCLEEMLNTQIPTGYLYYGKTKHRVKVEFDEELRNEVSMMISEMYALIESGKTPKPELKKACANCSLVNICMPKLSSATSVDSYIARFV